MLGTSVYSIVVSVVGFKLGDSEYTIVLGDSDDWIVTAMIGFELGDCEGTSVNVDVD